MTKIAYFGPIGDGTGIAVAANRTILGLDAAGFDVVACNFTGSNRIPPPNKVQELMKKSILGADIVIQNHIPSLFNYIGGVKNIGYFFSETTHFRPSNWQYHLNLMDEVWVSCPENAESAARSGVRKPIKVVPIPGTVEDYTQVYETLPIGDEYKYKYKFYCIGDYSNRKNIIGLVQAYFEEFTRFDNVVLVLKTYCDSKNSQESMNIITQDIQKLKMEMRKHTLDVYPPVILITDYMSVASIMGMHQMCDCFISLEKGAAFNLPSFDAMAFGNAVIVNGYGGQTQFVNGNGTAILDFMWESVGGMSQCPFNSLYTSYEQWGNPNMESAKSAMRVMYNNGKKKFDRHEWLSNWNINSEVVKNQFRKAINE